MTINDLAKYCGVSRATVSYALNDSPEISKETKEKIRKAAIELNYYPSNLARGLKHHKTNCIAIFITGFEGTAHTLILSGLAKSFERNGKYQMLVSIADKDVSLVRMKMVDLAVIMDARMEDETIRSISEIVPIVCFDKNIIGHNIYPTFISNIEAIQDLTSNLIEKGLKRVGYLLGSSASSHNYFRYKGYLKALKDHNIPLDTSIVFDANAFTKNAGYETINNVLKQNPHNLPFDALVCGNDELAIGAIKALKDNGYDVPKDVKVTGFDNTLEGSMMTPSLTTVDVDWVKYGEIMGDYAFKILKDASSIDNDYLLIDTTIIERDSSK